MHKQSLDSGLRMNCWTLKLLLPAITKRENLSRVRAECEKYAPIYLLLAYPKNVADDLSNEDKKALSAVTAQIKATLQRKRVTT